MTKKELGQIVGGLFALGVIVWAVSYALRDCVEIT